MEIVFKGYGYILENPLDMEKKLKEISKEIRKIDAELASVGVEQVGIFEKV